MAAEKFLQANCGNHYKEFENGDDYVLSSFQIGNKWYACLISTETGNRFRDPVEIKLHLDISEKEAKLIFKGFIHYGC